MSENKSDAKLIFLLIATVVLVTIIFLFMYFVEVDQTHETKLPEVNANVTDGKLPEFEVKNR